MARKYSDTELLDGLQGALGQYTGKVVCRWSIMGRGWRLHETSDEDGIDSVREAVTR